MGDLYAVSLIVRQAVAPGRGCVSIRVWVGRAADEAAARKAVTDQWLSDARKGRTPPEDALAVGATKIDGPAVFSRVITFIDPSAYATGGDDAA